MSINDKINPEITVVDVRKEFNYKVLFDLLTEIRLYWKDERLNRVTEDRTTVFAKVVGEYRLKVLAATGITTSENYTEMVLENKNGYVSVMGNAVNTLIKLDKILASLIDPDTLNPYIYGWEYKIIK
ncbi:MAG: hypothetical protein ACRCXX_10585 [Cetobacterium sp.]|uniref:hypothetical protein n=1 Tax=Cetobacterium sp. TaxID=2071632 RepID=UPI003F3258BE